MYGGKLIPTDNETFYHELLICSHIRPSDLYRIWYAGRVQKRSKPPKGAEVQHKNKQGRRKEGYGDLLLHRGGRRAGAGVAEGAPPVDRKRIGEDIKTAELAYRDACLQAGGRWYL
jgi:hypothetical protein